MTDAAGTRTISYNRYGEAETDSLLAGSMTHTITEQRDTLGRSTGYVYTKNDIPQQQTSIGYGADGRIATAGFTHQGEHKEFIYSYLPGTHLLHTLTHPNGLTLTQSYDNDRDLPTDMSYSRADALVVQRAYTYDILGRPTARNLARYGTQTSDTFGYNTRSELTTAHVNSADYSYAYDAIGNRATAVENSSGVASRTEYRTNNLNQYTAEGSFRPEFDADGNQTLIKTSTGIWSVTYNAKNRPVLFTKSDGSVTVECTYDTMGRRATKKVTTNGALTEHRRFLYRGYLQIACCDLTRAYTPALWYILWDPTQPTATRPLAIQKNGTWYTYGWDLTKNICETYRTDGRIDLAYTYTPYGEVSPAHTYDRPIRWSSEYHDVELGLFYYNYRHYNPAVGRWMNFDPLEQYNGKSRYSFASPIHTWDKWGLLSLLRCKRYKWQHEKMGDIRLTSVCTLTGVLSSEQDCCQCKEEKNALDNVKTQDAFAAAYTKLLVCLLKADGAKSFQIDNLIANTGHHHPNTNIGDGFGKKQRIPAGAFRILPGYSSTYLENTPGITDLSLTVPGKAAPRRSVVWIHQAWGNVDPQYETESCLAFVRGEEKTIKNNMLNPNNCGGLYLFMIDAGDATPEQAKDFSVLAEQHTPVIPASAS